ncbi:unnamed protein product [Dicrocoelium dendriticum]|nr:unnamed protein product [Dicrocoelium dendriticum]
MGGDGGSIPRRVELVKAKKKPERANRRAANAALWRHCTLSQDRLRIPIVSCQLGRLYNKESVINKLLSRSNTNDVAEHIRRLKDVRELRLTVNNSHTQESDPLNDATGEFYCPVTGLEMSGVYPFVYLWTCGCVFAKKALDVVNDYRCMQCGTSFTEDDIILLNPQTESEIAAAKQRLAQYVASSSKAKRRSADSVVDTGPSEAKQKPTNKPNTNTDEKHDETDEVTEEPQHETSSDHTKPNKSIQEDPNSSSVYKSLFTTSEQAKRQPKPHWVTYNPLYFR